MHCYREDGWNYYTLRVDEEINSEIGVIRFYVDPHGYIKIEKFFSWIVLNTKSGPLRKKNGYGFRCTLGMCANYFVQGEIMSNQFGPYLKIRVRETEDVDFSET